MNKEAVWKKFRDKTDQIVDGVGKGIDNEIKDTITALNVLGVNTSGSCECHLDWGTGSPYVDVVANNTKKINRMRESFHGMFKDGGNKSKPFLRNRKRLGDKISLLNRKGVKKVLDLLGNFYNKRLVPFDQRLVINDVGWGEGRIESQGAIILTTLTRGERAKCLKSYQREMKVFTDFLKGEFYKR